MEEEHNTTTVDKPRGYARVVLIAGRTSATLQREKEREREREREREKKKKKSDWRDERRERDVRFNQRVSSISGYLKANDIHPF